MLIQYLSIEQSYLILCSITNKSLRVGEGDIAWCCAITLVVGNDLHLAMLKHANTRVCRSKVDPDRWSFCHCTLSQNKTTTSLYVRQVGCIFAYFIKSHNTIQQ